jgi:tRNA(adenine34) deaminase
MDLLPNERQDVRFMKLALAEAERAANRGEVPVGAVVTRGDEVMGRGYNRREELRSPLAHAETAAIDEAARAMQSWRLTECTLYVTLEPCIMCVGAILQARLQRLVFGCLDRKAGAVESLYRMCDDPRLNHRLPVQSGVLAEECALILGDFFSRLRENKLLRRDTERWPSPVEGA